MSKLPFRVAAVLVLAGILTAVSVVVPVKGRNLCGSPSDKNFTYYNDIARGVPFAFYKEAQTCGDYSCTTAHGGNCSNEVKVLRRSFSAANLVLDFLVLAGVTALLLHLKDRVLRRV